MSKSDFTLFDGQGNEIVYEGRYKIIITDKGVGDNNPLTIDYNLSYW